jgi:putative ABC transport system permease protein
VSVTYALRAIWQTRGLSLGVIITLATGVAMNAAVFAVFNGLLLRANVTRDSGSFVQLYARVSDQWTRELDGPPSLVTLEDYEIIRDRVRTLSAVTVSRWGSFSIGAETAGDATATVRGEYVSCDYLSAHVGPMRVGRGLLPEDCAATGGSGGGAGAVVVLTERGWTLHFARDPNIMGRVVRVNDHLLTVVGIAPDDAVGGPVAPLLYVPYTLQPVLRGPADFFRAPLGRYAWLSLSGRLRPGSTLAEAQAELNVITRQIDRLHPGQQTALLATDGALIHEPDSARTMPIIMLLCLGTTLLILMMVCANVGTLLLARAVGRRHETAVRVALGAGRGQLLRQLLLETVLLGGIAALVGLAIAWPLPARLVGMLTDFPLYETFGPDWRVFGFTFGIAFLAGCAAGVSPALETVRVSPSSLLNAGGPGGGGATVSARLRALLIANQLSVSLALLIAIGLFARAQDRLLAAKFDFDADRMLIASIDLTHASYNGPAARAFYDRLLPMLTATPGVRAVALASPPPFNGIVRKAFRREPGGTGASAGSTIVASVRAVSPEYFSMIGIRVIAGRVFTDPESRTVSEVMPLVVSESFARTVFPGGGTGTETGAGCVGRRVIFGNDAVAEIVGIVSDTASIKPTMRDEALIYQPMSAANVAQVTPLVRFDGDARAVSRTIRAIVQTLDPRLTARPETIATAVAREASQYTTVLKLTAVPAALALFLALVGIYGITMFTATQRTQEIGVRIALGASTLDVVTLFLASLRQPLLYGIAAGCVLVTISMWLLRATRLDLDISPADPLAYVTAILILIATATIAALLPALRAARMQPWVVLRRA